jgi:spore maturation protein CgeB
MMALCWEKAYIPYLEKQGFNMVRYLPLATDPSLFSLNPARTPSKNLGFIGSAMGGAYLENIRRKFIWSDALTPLVDEASDTLLAEPEKGLSLLLKDIFEKYTLPFPPADDRNVTWLCSYIIHTASMKKRRSAARELVPDGLELFGDPEGWKEVLGNAIVVHPNLDYSTQLCSAYNDIAVNLNITSCQMPGAVNQRVFDVPLSGSFVLSDNQKDLGELFDLGREAVAYENSNELKDMVKYYTVNSTERQKISEAARKRILAEHTYFHRVKRMHTLLFS